MNLRFCLRSAFENDIDSHPQKVMKGLGIKYERFIPQSLGDQWWFIDCTGNTENLPSYLSEMELSCHKQDKKLISGQVQNDYNNAVIISNVDADTYQKSYTEGLNEVDGKEAWNYCHDMWVAKHRS